MLIVGGGSGIILEDIAHIHTGGLHITYVEISSRMMAKAKRRNWGQNRVDFVNESIEQFNGTCYDVIITPFLFDNFKKEKVEQVFAQLNSYLAHNGLWLHVDFRNTEKSWQRLLLKMMYLFFKIVSKIEADALVNTENLFAQTFKKVAEQLFYDGFIQSVVYKKMNRE